MNLFKKQLLFFILLLFTTSCATDHLLELSQKEHVLKSRNDYQAYLALEYLQFSYELSKNNAKDESKYFAKKGLRMAQNEEFIPENPLKWDADAVQLEEIIAMQRRLEVVLIPRMLTNLPIQLAHLSYLYDCWVSKESKPIFRASELAKCRSKFYKLLGEVEYYIDDLRRDKQPKTIIIEPVFKKFEIKFDYNSSKINDKARKKLLETIAHLESLGGNYRILLVGNTDRSGSKLYNQRLAFKRAKTVQKYLVRNGVAKESTSFRSLGEEFPDILTKDGVKQKRNRSVGIYILTGADSFESYPLPLIENVIYRSEIKARRLKRGLTN